MQDTPSPDDDSQAAIFLRQGREAFDRGDLLGANELALKAITLYERDGDQAAVWAYWLLGSVAYWSRNFDDAEAWYLKALAIFETNNDKDSAARIHHYLSFVTSERGEFDLAEEQLRNAIRLREELNDLSGLADSYHQLGLLAHKQEDFDQAETWYQKSLDIEEQTDNTSGVAKTYNNLGSVANARGDHELAKELVRKSITLKEQLDDRAGIANSYHQLGVIAESQDDYTEAKVCYLKSIRIKEDVGDRLGVGESLFNLSDIAHQQGNRLTARAWGQKSAAIFEDLGRTDHLIRLAGFAAKHRDREEAERLYRRTLGITERDSEIARCCLCLGNLCLAKGREGGRDYAAAADWFRRSLEFNQGATWNERIVLRFRLWWCRLVSLGLK